MNSSCQSFSVAVGSLLTISTSEDFVVRKEEAAILSDTEIHSHLSVTETWRIHWNAQRPF